MLIQNSASRIDGVVENLGIFVPKIAEWFPDAVRHKDRVEGLQKVQAYLRGLIEEHGKSRIPGQPRDLTDAYLELSEARSETESSFHPNGTHI